jgi:ParB family chromosome partitioning protein
VASLPAQGEKRIVSLDRLIENPANERRTFRNMDGLVSTVKSVGIIEPLIVEPTEDGHYLIVVGHRRHRAAKIAGLPKVPVIIGQTDEATRRRRKSIISNVQRENVDPVEMAEGLQALLDEDDAIKTQADLANAVGKDKAWVSGMLRILTLPPRLLRRVGTSQLSLPYDTMIRIARLDDAKAQAQLLDAALQGATVQEIRQRIDQARGRPSPPSRALGLKKPKEVYSTDHDATVIVQSTSEQVFTPRRKVAALKQALRKAQGKG